MDDERTITAGSLFCLSTGEYSDYGYNGHFVALEDIPRSRLSEIAEETKREFARLDAERDAKIEAWDRNSGEPYPPYFDAHNMFIAAVIKAGLVLAVTCAEIHIGSYGDLCVPA